MSDYEIITVDIFYFLISRTNNFELYSLKKFNFNPKRKKSMVEKYTS